MHGPGNLLPLAAHYQDAMDTETLLSLARAMIAYAARLEATAPALAACYRARAQQHRDAARERLLAEAADRERARYGV